MRVHAVAAIVLLSLTGSASAAPVILHKNSVQMFPTFLIADEASSIHAIISQQIEAFRQDDGATAYSFAAPSLKLYFPTAEAFMAMVRNGYQPIYRAQNFSFGDLKELDGKFVQSVAITGPNGDSWRAIYTFVRQDDGSLKIVSCYLVKDVTA